MCVVFGHFLVDATTHQFTRGDAFLEQLQRPLTRYLAR
jgi:hypothetical protein